MELTSYLLSTSHEYVCLGVFSTDKLENGFSKLRQGSGGAYFITVQQIFENTNIQKTRKLLKNMDMLEDVKGGHNCDLCNYKLDVRAAEIFDGLVQLEEDIPLETKKSLFHIAGYVTRKDYPY